MKLEDHHHLRIRELSEKYDALLVQLPQELRATAMQYIMNFMDALMATPLTIASHWLHLISLDLLSLHLNHQDRRTIHALYSLAMKDLTIAERAEHERKSHAARRPKSQRQVGKVVKRVLLQLDNDT